MPVPFALPLRPHIRSSRVELALAYTIREGLWKGAARVGPNTASPLPPHRALPPADAARFGVATAPSLAEPSGGPPPPFGAGESSAPMWMGEGCPPLQGLRNCTPVARWRGGDTQAITKRGRGARRRV